MLTVKEAEKQTTEDFLELVYMQMWDCECTQELAASLGIPKPERKLTAEERGKLNAILSINRMVRENPPTVDSPKQV